MTRWADGSRGERGSGTVLALVLVLVLATVALAGGVVGGILVGQRRAAAAADLAALAAAESVGSAGAVAATEACGQAAKVAKANQARLTTCLVEGLEVAVRVSVPVRGLFGAAGGVPGRARAGPTGLDGVPGLTEP